MVLLTKLVDTVTKKKDKRVKWLREDGKNRHERVERR